MLSSCPSLDCPKVSNDDYMRTTSKRHIESCHLMWNACKDDIYLGNYSGWYNVREETFVTEAEAEAQNYTDPISGKPLTKTEEER